MSHFCCYSIIVNLHQHFVPLIWLLHAWLFQLTAHGKAQPCLAMMFYSSVHWYVFIWHGNINNSTSSHKQTLIDCSLIRQQQRFPCACLVCECVWAASQPEWLHRKLQSARSRTLTCPLHAGHDAQRTRKMHLIYNVCKPVQSTIYFVQHCQVIGSDMIALLRPCRMWSNSKALRSVIWCSCTFVVVQLSGKAAPNGAHFPNGRPFQNKIMNKSSIHSIYRTEHINISELATTSKAFRKELLQTINSVSLITNGRTFLVK